MKAKFNPTGTHTHKGFLKVRIDLYPEPTDKTYKIHHVQVPVYPPEGYQGKVDEEGQPANWIDSLPKIWQLNPALCHFIKIKEASTKADLTNYLEQILPPTIIKTLDDSLILPNSSHLISPFMRDKAALTTKKIATKDIEDLITSVNSRFADLSLEKASGDKGLPILPQTIDIGAAAINRTSYLNVASSRIDSNNPANAAGTIDTVEVWAEANIVGFRAGTFYLVSGTDYKCRDTVLIGSVTSASKQTFSGLSFSVETDDYIGCSGTQGQIEWTSSLMAGIYWASGDHLIPDDQATYTFLPGDAISLYGTGEEAAAGITVTPATIVLSDAQFVPILKETTTPTTLALSDTQYR